MAATQTKPDTDERPADAPVMLKEPKAAQSARADARAEQDEIREHQAAEVAKQRTNAKRPSVETAFADHDSDSKGEPGTLVFAAVDGGITVYSSAKELHFGRDNALALQRALGKITAANL